MARNNETTIEKGATKGYTYVIYEYFSNSFNQSFFGVRILRNGKVVKTQRLIDTQAHAKTWVKGLIKRLVSKSRLRETKIRIKRKKIRK